MLLNTSLRLTAALAGLGHLRASSHESAMNRVASVAPITLYLSGTAGRSTWRFLDQLQESHCLSASIFPLWPARLDLVRFCLISFWQVQGQVFFEKHIHIAKNSRQGARKVTEVLAHGLN
jgi:hypothetical protein